MRPEPCACGRAVEVRPQEGGTPRSGPTVYYVACSCGVREEFLGRDTGRRDVAVREWNRLTRDRKKVVAGR